MSTAEPPDQLVIVGTSLFAEIAHEYFTHDSDYEVVAFSVEREYLKTATFCGLPVVPFDELPAHYAPETHSVYVACTYTQLNRLRARLADESRQRGYALASYISSRAFVARSATIGEHCFIFEDNTIQPFVTIGDDCVLWSGNHIGHHSTIERDVFISSHVVISGSVTVGERSFLGVNATIVNNISIGRDNWLGPGVIITRTTPEDAIFQASHNEQRHGSARGLLGR